MEASHYKQFIFPQFSAFLNLENTILTHAKVFQKTKRPLKFARFREKKFIDRFFYTKFQQGTKILRDSLKSFTFISAL
jgi:hypothetical protein